MPVKQVHYEALLAEYSNHEAAIALLRNHRPYLEMIPSMRRPDESVITIPLPVVRIRKFDASQGFGNHITLPEQTLSLPCDLAIVMCDPEWKIKMGVEILLFIHRPQEDFSQLLGRWRQTQVWLDKDYEWLMPLRHQHILSEGADRVYPLFIVFGETPTRIKKGLAGACLPFVIQTPDLLAEEEMEEIFPTEEMLEG
ncbi:MAG: hypothetical protein WBG70_20045 [Spirulinaceae cyanobacterium]